MRGGHPSIDADMMYSMLGASRSGSYYAAPSFGPRTLTGRMRDFVNASKLAIEIELEDAHPDNTYTTRDELHGKVTIYTQQNTRVDRVDIFLLGTAFTLVERMATTMYSNRNEAHHQFLKLIQPIAESSYPDNDTFEVGRTYSFPFTFTVPEHLMSTACRHATSSQKLKDAHLQIPPTLNDPEVTPPGMKAVDDLSCDMVRISYGITVRVNQDRDGKDVIVGERQKKVRIIPAVEEQPPIHVEPKDEEYSMRKEKSIRKGLFQSRLGNIVMEAAQPAPFVLSPSDLFSGSAPSIMPKVVLRFDPSDPSCPPPKLGSLTSKLRITTFLSTSVMRDWPTKATLVYDPHRAYHTESILLSSRVMASAQWERQAPHTSPANVLFRRDSALSASSTTAKSECPQQSSSYSPESPFYVAELLVPLTLPTDKLFVPTFHCCIVSRVYTLELQLSVPSQVGPKGVATTLTLKLPIQISADRVHPEVATPTVGTAMTEDMMAYYEAQVHEAVAQGEDYFFGVNGGRRSLFPMRPEGESADGDTARPPPVPRRAMSEPFVATMRPRYGSMSWGSGAVHSSDDEGDENGPATPRNLLARRNTIEEAEDEDLPPDYSLHHPPRGGVIVHG